MDAKPQAQTLLKNMILENIRNVGEISYNHIGYILETSLKANLQDMTPLKITPFNASALHRVNISLSLGGG